VCDDELQTTSLVGMVEMHAPTSPGRNLIVVLDHGQVIEVGSHPALIGRRGLYAELFALQVQSDR
jgi:ABC-type transport system involved in cytochrome bd biosynthesis fused ATPase/permease subunit